MHATPLSCALKLFGCVRADGLLIGSSAKATLVISGMDSVDGLLAT